MEKERNRYEALIGIAVLAGLVTGAASLLAAAITWINAEWVGLGLCLGAAALAFGLTTNALLRD